MAKTLYDKIFDDHVVERQDDGTCLLYIDRHLVHEVTSPQAFEGLRMSGRKVRAPEKTLAVVDHNVPTSDRTKGIDDDDSRIQVETLATNARDFGVEYFNELDKRQGIVHVIGPEQGFTLPGTTIVCGDSHTSTHGAFGALAHGIGTSEVEHVLATQTLIQRKAKNMRISVDGALPKGVTAKDIILAIIGEIGTAGGTGHVIEYAGEAIRALSMEGRMTVCNMSIEGGARAGMIAPDEKTFDFIKGRPKAPKGGAWDMAMRYWETLQLGRRRVLRRGDQARRRQAAADRHLGHQPRGRRLHRRRRARSGQGREREQARLDAARARLHGPDARHQDDRRAARRRLDRLVHQRPHRGSARRRRARRRQEDLRAPRLRDDRAGLRPRQRAGGSRRPRQDLQGRGLRVARAGLLDVPRHEPRPAEAAAALRLDLEPQLRGPPGRLGRTHLVSPIMAAAAAIDGHFVDIRSWGG